MKLVTVAAVLAAALIALAAVVAAAAALVADERTVRGTVEGSVRAVVLDLDAGDVEVRGGPGPVAFERRERSLFERPEVRQSLDGGVLRIEARCDDVAPGPCSVDLTLRVPDGTRVQARSDAGDVDLHDLAASAVRAESFAGDVHARAVRTPSAELRSDAGDVQAVDVRAGRLALHSDAGDVEAEEVSAERVALTANAGDADGELLVAPAALEARSDAGDVVLTVPAGRYALDARSDAGEVRVEDGLVRDAGAARRLVASTDAGDVDLAAR
jgi:hypothetical protein